MSQTHEDPTLETAESEADVAGSDVSHSDVVADVPTDDAVRPDPGPGAPTEESEAATDSADTVEGSPVDLVDADALAMDKAAAEAHDGADAEPDDSDDEELAEGATGSTRRSRRAPSRDLLEREGEIAADFLETLMDICDLDGDLDVDIDGDRAAVSIVDSDEGRVPRRLVGTDGKVLDALQELTRLAVYSATGERSRLILDIAGHRADRRTTLVEQAQTAIAAVQATGDRQALTPMSAFERKIVHDEVLAAGLHSESDGVEPQRFVVVLPA